MKDTLSVIQKGSEIAKIVSKVLMVFGIVVASLCLVSIILLAAGAEETIMSLVVNLKIVEEFTVSQMYVSLASGIIMSIALALNAGFTTRYFKNELKAGTPFTFDGAQEMFRLGISIMAITLGATILADISEKILDMIIKTDYSSNLEIGGSFSFGVMFFLMSFVCKHGAEVSGKEIAAK